MKLTKQGKKVIVVTVLLVILAVIFRVLGNSGFHSRTVGLMRSGIYIFLFAAWGVSLKKRIIQGWQCRYMVGIAVCMALWFLLRTLKYHFIPDGAFPDVRRLIWYAYYIPMLLIPMLSLFTAVSLGKPDQYRASRLLHLLWVPTILLTLIVLTNDLHQTVFVFPKEYPIWTDDHYSYGPMYGVVMLWILISAVLALGIIFRKCRLPHSKKILWLPLVPFCLMVVYAILYIMALPVIRVFLADMTTVSCLLTALVFESCIQCSLIQSNTGYEELFMVGRLGAQITDQENHVCLASSKAKELTDQQRKSAEAHSVSVDKTTLIKSKPIHFGHVLWQEDVSELTEAIEQVEENNQELAESNRIRRENLDARKKILTLQEKNRANDLLHRETAGQIDLIHRLLAQYDTETDEQENRKLLAGAAVVGAYIKRYGNLLLAGERAEAVDIRDLSRCFEESFINLELLDVNCLCSLPSDISLMAKDMLHIYRAFEAALEDCLFDLRHIWVNAREKEEQLILTIDFVCDTDLSQHASKADAFSCDAGSTRFTFRLKKGGAEK